MPRKRKVENRGLPTRWTAQHGALYYRVPRGLEKHWDGKQFFRLGKTLPEAYRKWAERVQNSGRNVDTIRELLDRYLIEVIPQKAPKTQSVEINYIKRLSAVFGALSLIEIKPRHIYQYVDQRSKKKTTLSGQVVGGVTAAHHEIKVLKHAFTKAVEWGCLDRHPFRGEVRLQGKKPRDRYIEDWEVLECLSLNSRRIKGSVAMLQAYIRIKLMTGMARSDLLRLNVSDLKDDGIHVRRHKTRNSTGKSTIYLWTHELRAAIDMAKSVRPVISAYLFCTHKGTGYINERTGNTYAWNSLWNRFMERVMKETKIKERFTEHDLRAKCASDAKTLEHARALLSHADARTTNAIYRRKAEIVKPLKNKF